MAAALMALSACDWDKFDQRVNPISDGGAGGAGGLGMGGETSTGGSAGGGGMALPNCGAMSLIGDNFDDDMVEPFWSPYADSGGGNSEGGALTLTLGASSSSDSWYGTLYFYDFREKAASVEVVSVAAVGDATQIFEIYDEFNNSISIQIRTGTLSFNKYIAGTGSTLASTTFNAGTHRYIRLRHAGEMVFWETSTDRTSWVNQASEPLSALFDLDTVKLRLRYDNNLSAAVDPAVFDELQIEGSGTGAWCPIEVLTDDFEDGVRSSRWARTSTQGEAHSREYDGQLFITLPKNVAGAEYNYTSSQPVDMTGSHASIKLVEALSGPSTARLRLDAPDGWLRFELVDDGIDPAMLTARYRANDTDTDLQSVTYDANAHRYWRIRDEGDRIVWELSADGTAYEVFASVQPAPFTLEEVTVRFGGLTQEANPQPGPLIFDDFLVTP